MTQETAKELLRKTKVIRDNFYPEPIETEHEDEQKITFEFLSEVINYLENDTDKLSVEKLKEELESCIQTLISVSIIANGDENIVIGNFVDSRLSKLAKTHENVTKYIEKVTGKNIDVVLAENAALEAEEGNE